MTPDTSDVTGPVLGASIDACAPVVTVALFVPTATRCDTPTSLSVCLPPMTVPSTVAVSIVMSRPRRLVV